MEVWSSASLGPFAMPALLPEATQISVAENRRPMDSLHDLVARALRY